MILAGIDEAGYGPALGPLVVSVSAFRIVDECQPLNLWQRLQRAVCRKPGARRLAVDDSKKLFSQKRGLRDLEEGLLPFVSVTHQGLPETFRGLLEVVTPQPEGTAYLDNYPWYHGRDLDLPCATYRSTVASRAQRLSQTMEEAGVQLLRLEARALEVSEFNRALEAEKNKAAVSFQAVGAFLKSLWERYPDETVDVVVDRQGGRRYYGPQLFKAVRPRGLRVEKQSPTVSVYDLTRRSPASARFRVAFTTGGETHSLPVALSSMLSKYLRETHMALFNRFWREQRQDLRPTAGYAVDASRFLSDIAPLRERLAIDKQKLVRAR